MNIIPTQDVLSAVSSRVSIPALVALAAVGFVFSASAQTSGLPSPLEKKDDVVALSPFVVNTDRDVGFVAASSLAGGRLGGELKDTPAAYSVLTRDFIDALNLTDLTDMAQWMPNTVMTPNQGDTDWANPTYAYVTSRGVGTNKPQRDFFPYGINFDSYNIERLDYGRGPNSILFGNSGYGSTPDVVSKRARPDRQLSELRLSYGSWENLRVTLDHNQPLRNNVALRLNAIDFDRKGWRVNDFEQRKAATLAGTWRPASHSEVRFEAETGKHKTATMGTNFYDYLSGWDGIHTYSAPGTANTAFGTFRTPSSFVEFTPTTGNNVLLDYTGWLTTDGGNRVAAIPLGGQLVAGVEGINANSSLINRLNLPANSAGIAEANSRFRVPSRKYSITADGLDYKEDYQSYTLAFTQQVGERFFGEAAVNLATVSRDAGGRGLSSGQGGQTRIDINQKLPNGQDNPNFLQPYNEIRPFPWVYDSNIFSARLALAYIWDKTRFGSFRVSVNGGVSRQDDTQEAWVYMRKIAADHRLWPSQDRVYFRYYWNDAQRPYDVSDREMMYQSSSAVAPVAVPVGLVRELTNVGNNSKTRTKDGYYQVSGDAKLLKGRLNLLTALRRDYYYTRQLVSLSQFDYPADWNGKTAYYKPDAPADYTALTYQPLDAGGRPVGPPMPADTRPRVGNERDPRYANGRFQDDYSTPVSEGSLSTYSFGAVYHLTSHVSLLANYAESYVPALASYDFSGKLIAPRSAQGRDYGIRFALLNNQVVANVIRYEGRDENSLVAVSNPRSWITTIANTAPLDHPSTDINQRNFPPPATGASDTTKKEVSGWELDLTANLSRNWRLTVNGALVDAYQVSAFPLLKGYLAANKETMKGIIQDAGGVFNGDVATMDPAKVSRSPDGPNAVAAWNSLMATVASFSDEKQRPTRLMDKNANLFTDYTIAEGRLKGLRLGGGANFRGKQVIGYRGADTIRDPNNPNAAIDDPKVGPLDYVYQPAYTTATAVISYPWRISRRLRCDLTLRGDNLFDYDKPIFIDTIMRPPNGDLSNPARVATPKSYTWITPRNFSLTASFKF